MKKIQCSTKISLKDFKIKFNPGNLVYFYSFKADNLGHDFHIAILIKNVKDKMWLILYCKGFIIKHESYFIKV